MINDPQVQEFIRQNPEVQRFFESQMAGLDPMSDEAKNKMLELTAQFRRQMEEQGFGRSADQAESAESGVTEGDETAPTPPEETVDMTAGITGSEQSFRVDGGRADLTDDPTAGGVVEGGETATTPPEETVDMTAGLVGSDQSFRVDDGRADIPDAGGTGAMDDGATPTGDTVTPPTNESQDTNRPPQGIDTVWDDVKKDDRAPGITKDEHFFESKYKHFFDSEKGKEAWGKFENGLKNAKTVDDLFAAMVFGMLNFPFDMLNAYLDHRKAEGKRMEDEYMKNLDANHNEATGRHRDTQATFIKKLHDANNNAVRQADPKLWEAMEKAGIVDEHGNVDKGKLKNQPELAQTYDRLSASVGKEARDAWIMAYDGVDIPREHPMWQKYLAEKDRLFQTTQAHGGLQNTHQNEPIEQTPPEQTPPEQTPPAPTPVPPTPVPPSDEELRRLREENAYLRGQNDAFRQMMETLGRVGVHVTVNVNNTNEGQGQTQGGAGNDTPQPVQQLQDPQQAQQAQATQQQPARSPRGFSLKGTYYDEVSAGFPNIQSTIGNDELTEKKVKELLLSQYAKENNKDKKGFVMHNIGGAAYSFASVVKDKFKSGDITFEQAQKLAQYGLNALKERKRPSEKAKDGLGFCEQLLKAENAEEMFVLYEQYKESLREKWEKRQAEATAEKPQPTQEAPAPQKPTAEKPQPTQEAPAPQKPTVEKPQPTQEAPAPQKPQAQTLDQRVQNAMTASREQGAELADKTYKNESARKGQMTKANNKILDKMLEGLSPTKQQAALKKLNNQILAQAKEQGLDANTENLKRAIENKCRDLSSRKVDVSKRAEKNQIRQSVVEMVKDKVPAKQAVKMAGKGAVKRTAAPMSRQATTERA